jgi:hypothetical protein
MGGPARTGSETKRSCTLKAGGMVVNRNTAASGIILSSNYICIWIIYL